jgi:hypothetical protein
MVIKDLQEQPEQQVHKDLRVLQDHKVDKDSKVLQVLTEIKVTKDQLEQLAH